MEALATDYWPVGFPGPRHGQLAITNREKDWRNILEIDLLEIFKRLLDASIYGEIYFEGL